MDIQKHQRGCNIYIYAYNVHSVNIKERERGSNYMHMMDMLKTSKRGNNHMHIMDIQKHQREKSICT